MIPQSKKFLSQSLRIQESHERINFEHKRIDDIEVGSDDPHPEGLMNNSVPREMVITFIYSKRTLA